MSCQTSALLGNFLSHMCSPIFVSDFLSPNSSTIQQEEPQGASPQAYLSPSASADDRRPWSGAAPRLKKGSCRHSIPIDMKTARKIVSQQSQLEDAVVEQQHRLLLMCRQTGRGGRHIIDKLKRLERDYLWSFDVKNQGSLTQRLSWHFPVDNALAIGNTVEISFVFGIIESRSRERSHSHDTVTLPKNGDMQLPFPRGENAFWC